MQYIYFPSMFATIARKIYLSFGCHILSWVAFGRSFLRPNNWKRFSISFPFNYDATPSSIFPLSVTDLFHFINFLLKRQFYNNFLRVRHTRYSTSNCPLHSRAPRFSRQISNIFWLRRLPGALVDHARSQDHERVTGLCQR